MAFVPTVLTGAVGDKSMGKPAPNKPDDVKKIQALLKKALGTSAPVFTNDKCDDTMKRAIAEFQQAWGSTPDSTIDPHGQTLKHLDRLANPLVLKPITKSLVAYGGYVIGYTTCDGQSLPTTGKGYTLHLGFPAEANSIEVTGRPAHDLLSYQENLGKVLKIFEKLACWATPVQCQLYVKYKNALISSCTSNTQILNPPVQPHNGRMLPLDEDNNGPELTYQGNVATNQFWGRMFEEVPGYDKSVFVWDVKQTPRGITGHFETEGKFRGFDCITYAGTTCRGENLHMKAQNDMAEKLGATKVDHMHVVVKDPKTGKESFDHTHAKDPKTSKEQGVTVQLEDAKPACVKDFFAANPPGYFLMWPPGHIVIVANGEVYEFAASKSGYDHTDKVSDWLEPYTTMRLTVRRLPKKPARAV